eukprot:NODE_1349_length_1574_cov_25.672787_g1212_i0.p1 GENE.NODE_1349_length_1574_cov_25.672787_g1212_i0~~NODE_1349_length_1574_cov_25.672787_g1212_i0.p1  ORF type:complete len:447 (-),score=79.36 NODE_1349_length_1574_cov_25.672787_g1212_i0:50-1390(-)
MASWIKDKKEERAPAAPSPAVTVDAAGASSYSSPLEFDYVDPKAYARFCEAQLAECEAERLRMLETIDASRCSEDDLSHLRWCLHQKEEENLNLQDEVARLRRENIALTSDVEVIIDHANELRKQEFEDRQTIAKLLTLTQPVDGDLTFLSGISNPQPPVVTKLKYDAQTIADIRVRRDAASGRAEDQALSALERRIQELQDSRLSDARQHEQQMREAADYFRARAQADAAHLRSAQGTVLKFTKALCQQRHTTRATLQQLRRQMWVAHEQVHRERATAQQVQLLGEQRAERLANDIRMEDEDALQHVRLQASAREAEAQLAAIELREGHSKATEKSQRLERQVKDLRSRCERLSQMRYYGLRGCESELHLLTRRLEGMERKMFWSAKPSYEPSASSATATAAALRDRMKLASVALELKCSAPPRGTHRQQHHCRKHRLTEKSQQT